MQFKGFEIKCDEITTRMYRDKYNEQCMCYECVHFRKHFGKVYPEVVQLLSQFGINEMLPLEIMNLGFETKGDMREYCIYYVVKGELPTDKIQTHIGQVELTLRNWNIANEAYANTGMEKPYFIIEVSHIFLKDIKGAFTEAVQYGREIEFIYQDKHYFESRNNDQDWYIYCEETKETQHFTSAEALLIGTVLDKKNINDIWDELIIECIL